MARYRALLDRRAQLDGAAGFEPLWLVRRGDPYDLDVEVPQWAAS